MNVKYFLRTRNLCNLYTDMFLSIDLIPDHRAPFFFANWFEREQNMNKISWRYLEENICLDFRHYKVKIDLKKLLRIDNRSTGNSFKPSFKFKKILRKFEVHSGINLWFEILSNSKKKKKKKKKNWKLFHLSLSLDSYFFTHRNAICLRRHI